MQPHEERVVAERKDLGEKLTKLSAFISGSEAFRTLDIEDQQLLREQRDVMTEYSDILGKRIARFKA